MSSPIYDSSRAAAEAVYNRRQLMKASLTAIPAVVGIAIVVSYYDIPVSSALQIVGITVAVALAVTLIGSVALYSVRHRSIASQATLLAFLAFLGAAAGSWAVAQDMFLARHDLAVLLVVLFTSGFVAALSSLGLSRRMNSSVNELIAATRLIDVPDAGVVDLREHPNEMKRLATELINTSARLKESQERAALLEQSRKDLMQWVSSDLREVVANVDHLAVIDGASEELCKEINRMQTLLADLLELNTVVNEPTPERI